jgi:hypothetical protein
LANGDRQETKRKALPFNIEHSATLGGTRSPAQMPSPPALAKAFKVGISQRLGLGRAE